MLYGTAAYFETRAEHSKDYRVPISDENLYGALTPIFGLIFEYTQMFYFFFFLILVVHCGNSIMQNILVKLIYEKKKNLHSGLYSFGVSEATYVAHWVITGLLYNIDFILFTMLGMFAMGAFQEPAVEDKVAKANFRISAGVPNENDCITHKLYSDPSFKEIPTGYQEPYPQHYTITGNANYLDLTGDHQIPLPAENTLNGAPAPDADA
jgi:hypothetical protein